MITKQFRTLLELCFIFVFIFKIPTALSVENEGWEQIGVWEDITVYRKEIPGSPVLAYRGDGVLPVPTGKLLSVIRDTDRKHEWMHRLKKAEVVATYSPYRRIEYMHAMAPWPLWDREFLYETRVELDAKADEIRVHFLSLTDPRKPEGTDKVRGWVYPSKLVLKPVEGGTKTFVQSEARGDPGGAIPKWVVNLLQKSMPPKSLKALLLQAKKEGINDDPLYLEFIKQKEFVKK